MRTPSLILAGMLVTMMGCRDEVTAPSGTTSDQAPDMATPTALADSVLLVVAGDIHANCKDGNGARATASLVDRYPQALVIPLGDNAGVHGTAAEYQCYGQTWGRSKGRTYATIGNHELNQDTAGTAHYDYFNGVGVDSGRAGHRSRGYYVLTYGGWRIFVANSHHDFSIQATWMTQVMAASPKRCTMAIWHSPLFTSNDEVVPLGRVRPWWRVLYSGGADVVLGGHAHNYERFAEVTPDGVVDTTRGIREFVVGTGGGNLFGFNPAPHAASRKRISTWGVLKLTLWPTRYRWQFIDVSGRVLDAGRDTCH